VKNDQAWEDEKNAAWHAFMQMQELLGSRLEQQLQTSSSLSNADYTILVVLSESEEHRLRVFEMGRVIGWEKSRLHHQLTRMSSRGLVRREADPETSRGIFAVLTDEGMQAIVNAAPAHNREVQRLFFDKIDREQVRQLHEISTRVLDDLLRD
jgi:DNA-binding MarR family transcriptional regulator